MAVERRILERVEKLLRLAGPHSGTSEHERASAALEAAKLIAEHGLVVQERPAPIRRASPSPRPSSAAGRPTNPTSSRRPGWVASTARQGARCALQDCAEAVNEGDPVWMRIDGFDVVYIHRGGPCGW